MFKLTLFVASFTCCNFMRGYFDMIVNDYDNYDHDNKYNDEDEDGFRQQTWTFSNASTAPWGPRPPYFSTLHDHTFLDTPHSVGLLWTSDQPVAETST
jgi:hypothetical protein